MPKTIHTVTLNDGSKVTRETASRKYTHVIIAENTQAEKDRLLAQMDAKITAARTEIAQLAARAATAKDQAEYAEAVAAVAFLDEEMGEHTCLGWKGEEQPGYHSHARWLCEAWCVKNGHIEVRYGTTVKTGYDVKTKADARVLATATGKTKSLEKQLKLDIEYRAGIEKSYVVGAQSVMGWSSSAANAYKAAEGHRRGLEKMIVTDNIETRERAKRATTAAAPGSKGLTPVEKETLAVLTTEPQHEQDIKVPNRSGRYTWKALRTLEARGLAVKTEMTEEQAKRDRRWGRTMWAKKEA